MEEIDFGRLQKDFDEAIAADAKYSRENDAKFRAVHQKVATYEEFKDIVAASHLQPLEKKDLHPDGKPKQPWNSACFKKEQKKMLSNDTDITVSMKPDTVGTLAQFTKYWTTVYKGNADRSHFLCSIPVERLECFFQNDIPVGVLEGAVVAFISETSSANASAVAKVLKSFTASSRFSLSLKFLGTKDKENLVQLLTLLRNLGIDVSTLAQEFEVSLS